MATSEPDQKASQQGIGPGSVSAQLSPAEKVKIFRQLFRGREDVYPVRFVSKSTGKAGYAPACANKFIRGVCDLPKVKCSDCNNQAFLPVDESAVLAHLRGTHVMGVYPMLEDDRCWLLAVDFDKSMWKADVQAFSEAAKKLDLPHLIERSRSGDGAHVWFFFSEPVDASAARKMGSHVITMAMSSAHEIGMDSYDRLFPNQDMLPRGGFGNLIALPLQHGPRQQGNSVFLDHELNAYPDSEQWSVLASVQRIPVARVARIASDAANAGLVIGLRATVETDDQTPPWSRPPPGSSVPATRLGALPTTISAVLAQRLFIVKEGIPSPLLNRIRRLAAFQNPEFYRRQSLRLSTTMTPRVIACAEDYLEHVALPRGCLVALDQLLRANGVVLELTDERVTGQPLAIAFHGKLSQAQENAVKALLEHDAGVLVAPPGSGKTVMGAYMVAARACNTLIVVHRRQLLDQWLAQLALFLGVNREYIGGIHGTKRAPTGRIDVAMFQSLVRRDRVADLVADYGQVIVDECHHVPAVQFERVLREAKARYVLGLTATPQRRDGHHPISEMQLGPIRHRISSKAQALSRTFAHRLIVRETTFPAGAVDDGIRIQRLYATLARDEARNALILSDIVRALQDGRSPIVLTERKEHLEHLARRLARAARHLIVLQGGMGPAADRATRARLEAVPANEERLILATGRYAGEGFDDARLDTLFLALPVSWKGTLIQYAGRLHRAHPDKAEVRIFDYVDREVPALLRMFEKRLRGYRAIGYARNEAPLGYAEPVSEIVVDPTDDVLRVFDHESATDRTSDFAE